VVRIASYNVENLFARPRVFHTADWSVGEPRLAAYEQVSALFQKDAYSVRDKADMKSLLVELEIYFVNAQGAVRRKETSSPRWAWLRKNRGGFDRQPEDTTKDIEIIADGRDDWIGWVELAKEAVDEMSTRMTAKVIDEGVDAEIIAVVEAEDRPSLLWFNEELLDEKYRHVMLVDGNDARGIDVGIMSKSGFPIRTIRSNVDAEDGQGIVFSRDCPEYEVVTQNGTHLFVLVNHFKSQSGGGGEKRRRQAKEVRQIVDRLVGEGKHVVVLGDLNEGPETVGTQAANLSALFDNDSPLVDVYSLPGFDVGPRPGTFDSCGIRNRLDYILVSQSLVPAFQGGEIFRKGLWGTRVTRPTAWETYPEIENRNQQASDHAAVFVDLDV
jgi:endonuclease/exonuclease/phosphatase family metal-dependent hydrolase